MGFNNRGAEYMLNRLKSLYFLDYPIGINIGKNKITAQERAIDDYKILLEKFRDFGTYIVINIHLQINKLRKDIYQKLEGGFIKEEGLILKLGKIGGVKPFPKNLIFFLKGNWASQGIIGRFIGLKLGLIWLPSWFQNWANFGKVPWGG